MALELPSTVGIHVWALIIASPAPTPAIVPSWFPFLNLSPSFISLFAFLKTPISMKRRLEFGWLRTISGFWEKTFPLIIKNVSPAEVVAIFPLALAGILLSSHGYLVEVPIIGLIALFLFYDEKSMDIYHYLYYFILFYIRKKPTATPTIRRKTTKIQIKIPEKIKNLSIGVTIILIVAIMEQLALRYAVSNITTVGLALVISSAVFGAFLIVFAISYVFERK
ncbi:hypothetical protein [Acidianus sp. RZ1]|uniref:hypothetical protein n=1 Tax=Acidianus sp. RZ1 TaxID=1540082 RepID=UPI001492CFBC|nr:hypothetical protein [Acidianus sp. RZ1]NON63526.1 hypothetical protein [Acidianus sp. RZ1]